MSLSINPNTTKAILIGISDYQYFTKIPPAKNVINDLKKALINTKILGLPAENVIPILNKRHDEIEDEILNFVDFESGNQEVETLIMFFVGHGHRVNGEFYLTGINSKKGRKSSLLPFKDIKEELDKSHLQQRIVILDACHSGEVAMSGGFEESWDVKGSYILTSAGRNEKSFFNTAEETKYTYFSARFLEILNSGVENNKDVIDLESLYNGLRGYHEKSTPHQKDTLLNINKSDFHLFHNARFDEFEVLFRAGQKLLDKLEFEKAEAKFIKASRVKSIDEQKGNKAEAKIKECENGLRLATAIKNDIDKKQRLAKNKAERELKKEQELNKPKIIEFLKKYVKFYNGQWDTFAWLDLRDGISKEWCKYEERFLAELLEKERTIYKEANPEFIETIVGKFIFVKGGTFLMGSPEDEPARHPDETQHEVELSNFYIGETTVTQGQWKLVMGDNPSSNKSVDDYPVENISWVDTQEFIEKLNDMVKHKYEFRLPTEAEWEYAGRGGIKSKGYLYAGSNNLSSVGWYWRNSGDKYLTGNYDEDRINSNNCKTHLVKQKKANELGIYDMSGNIEEWCEDFYDDMYYDECKEFGTIINPKNVTAETEDKILRGGSFQSPIKESRSTYRALNDYFKTFENSGFRLVISCPIK